ncbi:MAG: capsular polysaccharide biosynthesis protein [Paenibacillus sp.]|nr:capsular polysaccharide biosynthesis protein [Paenibacillus sp.]
MKNQAQLSKPEGFYKSLKEWRAIAPRRIRPSKNHVITNTPSTLHLTTPNGIMPAPHWMFHSFAKAPVKQREGTIAVVPDGRVCGAYCDVLTPDNKLLAPQSLQWRLQPTERHVWKSESLPPLKVMKESVALLAIKDSAIYYHWMMDVIPRILLLQQSGIHVQRYIVNGSQQASFQKESLALLGIPASQIIGSGANLHMQAKRLIIPGFKGHVRDKWSCDALRKALKENNDIGPVPGYERIYISREKARKRNVLNEPDVMDLLSQYGFRKVILEAIPLREQIRIFSSASVIVGPHGAGLTNIIFSNPGATIIEIFSPQLVHTCYPVLSSIVGHRHYYLIGEGERPPEYVNPHNRRADITVNVKQLAQLLKIAKIGQLGY